MKFSLHGNKKPTLVLQIMQKSLLNINDIIEQLSINVEQDTRVERKFENKRNLKNKRKIAKKNHLLRNYIKF